MSAKAVGRLESRLSALAYNFAMQMASGMSFVAVGTREVVLSPASIEELSAGVRSWALHCHQL
jgi:hypothetical protein